MAIILQSDLFVGTRRIRLFFSGPLASGAFTNLALYSVENVDGLGPATTNVVALFGFTSNPNAVELAIDADWTAGALYEVDCAAVPGADGSLFTGSIQDRYPDGSMVVPPNVEPETNDLELLLYGRDLMWNGQDFVEDSTGDLALISGRANWQGAMGRRMTSAGLTWDVGYGPDADESVDAPAIMQPALAGRFLAQARADDRTKQASVDYSDDPSTGVAVFILCVTGRDGLDPISVPVPLPVGTKG
jgi:hypothetical protein